VSEQRRVEKLEDEKWAEIRMQDLRTGDIFRIYELDGKLVITNVGELTGVYMWRCYKDAYESKDWPGTYEVACSPYLPFQEKGAGG